MISSQFLSVCVLGLSCARAFHLLRSLPAPLSTSQQKWNAQHGHSLTVLAENQVAVMPDHDHCCWLIINLIYTHTIIEKRVWAWGLPSPARPKRKSHATKGTRLHSTWAASLHTLYHVFKTLSFCSPSRTHTQFSCHAVPPYRASEPTLPSCSTDPGSS